MTTDSTEFLIVGSGIAGLQAALLAREHGPVTVLTKTALSETNTYHAQGGIAVATGVDDNPDLHFLDTIVAGAGLCDPVVVRALVDEGPDAVRRLIDTGVNFDMRAGELLRGLEAAHSVPRVLHAAGAGTGEEIQSTLSRAARAAPVQIFERTLAIDLIIEAGDCRGLIVLHEGETAPREIRARHVILATGGAGHLYSHTTNPGIATADGVALAIRAGAVVSGLEFFQFHPTALDLPGAPPLLLSEALRGAGAKITDRFGQRFLLDTVEGAELAPRDIVARAILWRLEAAGPGTVFLDCTELDEGRAGARFPGLAAKMLAHGINLNTEPVPIAPAAHYLIGGIVTDPHGRTSLPGLFVCGEVAATGVHGANRLASNSLLEAVVFARRVVAAAIDPPSLQPGIFANVQLGPGPRPGAQPLDRATIQQIMWENVGILRDRERLREAAEDLLGGMADPLELTRAAIENANLTLAGLFSAHAAYERPESRGAHFRLDFPEPEPDLARPTLYRIADPAPLILPTPTP